MTKLDAAPLGTDMFEAMASYLKDYKEAHAAARALPLPAPPEVDHVVFTGMGGSGIGADLVAALAAATSPRPIVVVKDYQVPPWVGPRTLVVATSYSGNTEETLSAVASAREQKARVAGIASGGALWTLLEREKLPRYRAPPDRQPRAALPLLFGALAGMAERVGLGSFALDEKDENHLHNVHVQLQPKLSGTEDTALAMAGRLHNRQPTIVAEGHLAPVAVRWKCQLNENAKMFARAEILPEANHNDLVPWAEGKSGPAEAVVLLRRRDEPGHVAARFDFLSQVVAGRGAPLESVEAKSRTPLGQSLELLMTGDYLSVYTAVLRHVDPTPVDVIGELKKRLERDGLARDARRRLGV